MRSRNARRASGPQAFLTIKPKTSKMDNLMKKYSKNSNIITNIVFYFNIF